MHGGIGGCATDRGGLGLGGLILAGGCLGLVGSLVRGLVQGGGCLRGRHHRGERGLRILTHVLGGLACGGEQGSEGILGVFRLVRGGFGLLALLVRRGGGGLIGSGVLSGSLMRGDLVGGLGFLGCLCGRSVRLGGLFGSLISDRSIGGELLLGLLLLGGGVGLGLVGGRNDRKIALGGGHDGQLARGDLVLDSRLERCCGGHAACQTADRDCLDFARVDGLAGLADDRRRVGILTGQLDLLAGQHQIVRCLLGAVVLGVKLVIRHASSLYLPTYYGQGERLRALALGRPLFCCRILIGLELLERPHAGPQDTHRGAAGPHSERRQRRARERYLRQQGRSWDNHVARQ